MTFHLYRDTNREWRWNVKARNGRILADGGEGYKTRAAMLRTLRKLFPGNEALEAVAART